jgi:hypothetical protein
MEQSAKRLNVNEIRREIEKLQARAQVKGPRFP